MNKSKKKKSQKKITRQEAIKNLGKHTAFIALGTFMILSPQKSQAQSQPPAPGGFGSM